ncbi:hypothetical protein GCM10010472_10960 [Pseudonocardia halophobica]|uniref:Uncharacterized protein n=1 Tax=Pseudonocardia halophobica TaxID=29401 RepID=A0A9W6NY73_9PSEU|nr:hypothetical protein [Pseudonocardia halophobica]GLL13483.1 hypothetical protein GCM10017577_46270 [Pseudonocardia halophobica]
MTDAQTRALRVLDQLPPHLKVAVVIDADSGEEVACFDAATLHDNVRAGTASPHDVLELLAQAGVLIPKSEAE